jgi:hypothetical protein
MGNEKIFDIKKIEKIFDDAIEETGQEILWEIENIYETAIDKFYGDYTPLYYNRTFSTYLASSGYDTLYSPINLYQQGDSYIAGIFVSSGNIQGNPYRASKDWVFDRTFIKGIHGIKAGNFFGKSLSKKFSRVKGNKYFEAIYLRNSEVIKKTSYYKGRTQIQTRIMSDMHPTPKAIMEKEFKRITKKKYINGLFNEILSNKLN